MKRPRRAASAEAVFLGSPWDAIDRQLQQHNRASALAAYTRASAACQACHVAENVGYFNRQPLFERELDVHSAN